MFNFLLPTLLLNGAHQSFNETYRDMFIIQSCGIPGSIVASLLIPTRFGQRGCMAVSTLFLAMSVFVFGYLKSPEAQLGASCAVAFLQNIMYGVIYSYTPGVFETSVRGTAMGIASALNRAFGCVAPLIGGKKKHKTANFVILINYIVLLGALLSLSFKFPLYASSICFVICSMFMFSLPASRNKS